MDAGKKMRIGEDFLHFLDSYLISTTSLEQHPVREIPTISYGFGSIKDDVGQQPEDFNGVDPFSSDQVQGRLKIGARIRGRMFPKEQRHEDCEIRRLSAQV